MDFGKSIREGVEWGRVVRAEGIEIKVLAVTISIAVPPELQ